MSRVAVVIAALLAASGGCKKKDDAPAPAPRPEAAAEAAASIDAPIVPEPAGDAAAKIDDAVPEEAVARGAAAIKTLKQTLVGALTAALQKGPVSAIGVCGDTAGAITSVAASDGITLGRMTRRPRNAANAVTGWQEDALGHFESLVAAGATLDGAVFARPLAGGGVAYAEPLVIAPLCVTCHGEDVAPDVTEALAARYPDDRATGYQVGELRGIAWAEIR